MKIVIGIPTYDNRIHSEVMQDLVALDLARQHERIDMVIHITSGPFLTLNRNLIMSKALKDNADWLLFWDSDIHVANPKFLWLMLETAQKNEARIVGLLVKRKEYEVGNEAFACALKTLQGYQNLLSSKLKLEPFEVDAMGCGVMLINLAFVRQNLEPPYFSFIDTRSGIFPEDWNFCEKVKEKGGKIMAEPRVGTIHYGTFGWIYEPTGEHA